MFWNVLRPNFEKVLMYENFEALCKNGRQLKFMGYKTKTSHSVTIARFALLKRYEQNNRKHNEQVHATSDRQNRFVFERRSGSSFIEFLDYLLY